MFLSIIPTCGRRCGSLSCWVCRRSRRCTSSCCWRGCISSCCHWNCRCSICSWTCITTCWSWSSCLVWAHPSYAVKTSSTAPLFVTLSCKILSITVLSWLTGYLHRILQGQWHQYAGSTSPQGWWGSPLALGRAGTGLLYSNRSLQVLGFRLLGNKVHCQAVGTDLKKGNEETICIFYQNTYLLLVPLP